MLRTIVMISLLSTALSASANLVSLNPQELLEASGQGGADLSWTLSLNHIYATDMTKNDIYNKDNPLEVFYKLSPAACGDNKEFCRLAISPNNHVDAQGNKRWLVFKQIQGTLQVDKFSLDGATIINALNEPQTALNITFYDQYPLKIRNLGFATMAIETGTGSGMDEGYAKKEIYNQYLARVYKEDGTYEDKQQDVPLFDKGAEKGFMGLNIHGNMHMSGNVKIFSYNCSGTGRC